MLQFFRKYQRFFFLIITVVIVISFSFFGTYSTMNTPTPVDSEVFTAIDGTSVKRSEVERLALFISTDAYDKQLMRGAWGPNFLNDGVIAKDFLETGLAIPLIRQYQDLLEPDFKIRATREKNFKPYKHPKAEYVSVENVWAYVAPDMKQNFDILKKSQDPLSEKELFARTSLFIEERKLPASFMRQLIKYQKQQYSWVPEDPEFEQKDLSLFGYHSAEDWFGQRFVRLASAFIINAAKVAKERGFSVSDAEAESSLRQLAAESFEQIKSSPYVGVSNADMYFREQLRRLGIDKKEAVELWKDILLFRRLFQGSGNAVLVDTLPYKQFAGYAKTYVEGDIYKLPDALRINSFRDLQKLEIYLNAVAERPTSGNGLLSIPTKFLTAKELSLKKPELVQKKYILQIAAVDKKDLEGGVTLKETWEWQLSDDNWPQLQKKFPALGLVKAENRDDRFKSLRGLDANTRGQVDAYAREEIVKTHPEWLTQALSVATPKTDTFLIREKGGQATFPGLKNGKELMVLLDKAPLAVDQDKATAEQKEVLKKLSAFSPDGRNYYKISLLEKSEAAEIVPYNLAKTDGTLDALVEKTLQEYYEKTRESHAEYKKPDGSWKNFADVQFEVAESYFSPILKKIKESYEAKEKNSSKTATNDLVASLRFYAQGGELLANLKAGKDESLWVAKEGEVAPWKWVKETFKASRGDPKIDYVNKMEVFILPEGSWVGVSTPPNGDIAIFHLLKKGQDLSENVVKSGIREARDLLSDDTQRALAVKLLSNIKEKNAIALDYLKQKDTPNE